MRNIKILRNEDFVCYYCKQGNLNYNSRPPSGAASKQATTPVWPLPVKRPRAASAYIQEGTNYQLMTVKINKRTAPESVRPIM